MNINHLQALIATRELTIKRLAISAGVAPSSIHRILNGGNRVQFATIGKLARALNVDVKELLTDD